MKNTRKIISLLLCFCIFFSMQAFALQFPDVTEDNKTENTVIICIITQKIRFANSKYHILPIFS